MARTFLVTGSSSGIGYSVASLLVERGDEVHGLCRSPKRNPEGVHPVCCDLVEESSVRRVFAEFAEAGVVFDGVVNAAGVAYTSGVLDGDAADWARMWLVNVQGLALCCQLEVPLMAPGGVILNLSSLSGHRVTPSGGMYAPSKFAVRALTESLRNELRRRESRIRVGTVSPGFVDTPILETYFREAPEQREKVRTDGMMLSPGTVGLAILGLLDLPEGVEAGDLILRSVGQSL